MAWLQLFSPSKSCLLCCGTSPTILFRFFFPDGGFSYYQSGSQGWQLFSRAAVPMVLFCCWSKPDTVQWQSRKFLFSFQALHAATGAKVTVSLWLKTTMVYFLSRASFVVVETLRCAGYGRLFHHSTAVALRRDGPLSFFFISHSLPPSWVGVDSGALSR